MTALTWEQRAERVEAAVERFRKLIAEAQTAHEQTCMYARGVLLPPGFTCSLCDAFAATEQCREGEYGDYGPQCQLDIGHHQRGEPCVWAPHIPGEDLADATDQTRGDE
ncbi:MAG: hypothetical protein JWO67_1069 [Streptosporangiaceae bacterium]|nr:hypothetical protein [Streptosporangiaceae bacterium]